MSRSQHEFLKHILDECEYLLRVTEGKTQAEVFNNDTLCRAIIRSIEIIGEAVKHLDDDFRLKYPEIEWKKIAGTRDIMIHHYFGIDYDIAWNIIQEKIPFMHELIREIIKESE